MQVQLHRRDRLKTYRCRRIRSSAHRSRRTGRSPAACFVTMLDPRFRDGHPPRRRAGAADGLRPRVRGRPGILVLPHPQDLPTGQLEDGVGVSVSRHVARQLVAPPRCVALRPGRVLRTCVPEAPIDEHCQAHSRKGDVDGASRPAGYSESDPIAKALAMEARRSITSGVRATCALATHPTTHCRTRGFGRPAGSRRVRGSSLRSCPPPTVPSCRNAEPAPTRRGHLAISQAREDPVVPSSTECRTFTTSLGTIAPGLRWSSSKVASMHRRRCPPSTVLADRPF